MTEWEPAQDQINRVYDGLYTEAEKGGYRLNPDVELVKDLIRGLLINEKRYGYWNCPCRLARGIKDEDLDIICPCDYRDADILKYGACYCGLYVSEAVFKGEKSVASIPESRPPEAVRKKTVAERFIAPNTNSRINATATPLSLAYPVWRCKVCGYLCARDSPPEICPVCRAKKERFERFL